MAATIKDTVDAFLASKGYARKAGKDDDSFPVLPLIIMDSALQLFDRFIKPIDCKRELKMYKHQWRELYHNFNMEYFRSLNREQSDLMIDLMDDFEENIGALLWDCHAQFMRKVDFEPKERQEVLACTLLISVLCQAARVLYEGLFGEWSKGWALLAKLDTVILKWQNLYYGQGKPNVKVDDDEQVRSATSALLNSIAMFPRDYIERRKALSL